jgi:hypothetical protein
MVFVCLLAVGLAGSALADVDVQRLTMVRDGIFTVLTVHAPGRVLSNHFVEEPKDGRPFRVVLDLCGANHKLAQKTYEQLPSKCITRIRTSQYATTPQNVVRIVLDLDREVTYKVSLEAEAITLALVTPDELVFEPWSSETPEEGAAYMASKPAVDSSEPAVKTTEHVVAVAMPTPSTTAAVPKPQEPASAPGKQDAPSFALSQGSDDVVMSHGPTPASQQQQTEPVKPVKTTPVAQVKTVAIAPPVESPAEKWDAVTPPAAGEPPAEQVWASAPGIKIELPHEPEQAMESTPQPDKEQRTYAGVVQYATPIGPLPVENTPSNLDVAKTAGVAETGRTNNLVETTAPVAVATPTLQETAPPVQEHVVVLPPSASDEQLPLLARLKNKFLGSPGKEQVQADAGTDSAALDRIRKLAAAIEEQPAEIPAIEPGLEPAATTPSDSERLALVDKIATVDPSVIRSLHAETEDGETGDPTTPQQGGKGTPMQVDDMRQKVYYERVGRRDPFDPLMEGQRSGLLTASLPRVDALRLVGILQDYDNTVALFEDMEGYGYVLREGDPVMNGEVKVIGENRVIFQIDDYGWVHTVTLELRCDSQAIEPDLATELEEE